MLVAGENLLSEIGEPCTHRRIGQGVRDCGIELADDVLRCSLRDPKQLAADQLARDVEIEATRQGAWRMWYLDTEQIIAIKGNVSAPWIKANMPKEGWPSGDGPENYSYSAVAPPIEPEDDGVVPPLVLKARQYGWACAHRYSRSKPVGTAP